jgi:hypothetical protein
LLKLRIETGGVGKQTFLRDGVQKSNKLEIKKDTTRKIREDETEAMKTKTAKVLPKTAGEITNGGLYVQRVRCGKANCKCARGEHHTAFYFFTRRRGKLVKFYVRRADVKAFSEIVEQAMLERIQKRQAMRTSTALLKQFRVSLWEKDRFIKTSKGVRV